MSNDRRWIFYDSMSKTQSNPITSDEAQMAIFKMKPKDHSRFFIWTNGWDNWQPLQLFIKSDQTYFLTHLTKKESDENTVKDFRTRDVLEMSQVTERAHKEITKSYSGVIISDGTFPGEQPNQDYTRQNYDVDEMSWSETQKPSIDFKKLKERTIYGRRDQRLELKLEILLITNKGSIFRSTSKNISLSGSLLEDNIPFDYYGVNFDIVIVNRNSKDPQTARLQLKASTVGDGLTQRLNFYDISNSQKEILKNLLQDYLNQQKKMKPKAG